MYRGTVDSVSVGRARRRGTLKKLNGAVLASAVFMSLVIGGSLVYWVPDRTEGVTIGEVMISEVAASNGFVHSDEDGDYPDWFEVLNSQEIPLDLTDVAVVNHRGELWKFPRRVIGAGERVVVFASGKDRSALGGELHTSFPLPRSGGFLALIDTVSGDFLSRVSYPAMPRNSSYGLVGADWCFFAFPTPGERNPADCFDTPELGAVQFSHSGGFYESAFLLTLSSRAKGHEILYTLDSSYPDKELNPDSTKVYDGPIKIVNQTAAPPRWAGVDTTVPNEDVPSALVPPSIDGELLKATTVRARVAHGQESVETFFVEPPTNGFPLPVVSIVTDGDCLFDEQDGIYVAGSAFQEALDENRFDPIDPGPRPLPANYLKRGGDFECPTNLTNRDSAWVQVCELGKECASADPSRLRIHGGWTRAAPQKSLRLYSNDEVGEGKSFLGIEGLNPDFEGYRNLILRAAWGSPATYWDDFLQSLVDDLIFDTQSSEPVAVFLNGEYWGLHNIRHRYDRHYVANRHGVNPDEVRILGNVFTVQEGPEDSHLHFRGVLTFLRDNDPTNPNTIDFVYDKVDVDTFYDFVALNFFVSNGDWPHNNVKIWREAPLTSEASVDGEGSPWRFLVYDLDGGSLSGNVLEGRFAVPEDRRDQGGYPYLWHRLMENAGEREKFLNRFSDLMNTSFHPEKTIPQLEQFAARVEPEIPRHIGRWNAPESVEAWHDFGAQRIDLLSTRPDTQRSILTEWFELAGPATLKVEVPDAESRIMVNSIELSAKTPGFSDEGLWSGVYFSGVPVTLSGETRSDYELVGWQVTEIDESVRIFQGKTVSLDVDSGVTVRPIIVRADG